MLFVPAYLNCPYYLSLPVLCYQIVISFDNSRNTYNLFHRFIIIVTSINYNIKQLTDSLFFSYYSKMILKILAIRVILLFLSL